MCSKLTFMIKWKAPALWAGLCVNQHVSRQDIYSRKTHGVGLVDGRAPGLPNVLISDWMVVTTDLSLLSCRLLKCSSHIEDTMLPSSDSGDCRGLRKALVPYDENWKRTTSSATCGSHRRHISASSDAVGQEPWTVDQGRA